LKKSNRINDNNKKIALVALVSHKENIMSLQKCVKKNNRKTTSPNPAPTKAVGMLGSVVSEGRKVRVLV
jgi:hypothetical protein